MTEDNLDELTTGAQRIVQLTLQKQQLYKTSSLGVNHWLLALIERHDAMVESLVLNMNIEEVRAHLPEALQKGESGLILEVNTVVQGATERARQMGKSQATERDLAVIILKMCGYLQEGGSETVIQSGKVEMSSAAGSRKGAVSSTLDRFGRDLTRQASEGKLMPVVGREDELSLVIETLCRQTKRNPVLVGPAGVGKTAIVEGLALRIAAGEVPDILKGVRLIALQPSNLVAGASMSGELEKRMQALVQEASQPGIILFIDEIHSIMGAGGAPGTTDIASILKPSLSRGEIACIAATTDEEYRRFIEHDSALERRFQPLRIHEPSPEQTLAILQTLQEVYSQRTGITISVEVLSWLVQFAVQYMRNRHFPDKAVDLLEQCYAYAVANAHRQVDIRDAQVVSQRMVGMPLALGIRLQRLEEHLNGQGVLGEDEIAELLSRLQVTLRGLDLRSSRPNAVALLLGEARQNSDTLAEILASALFGASDRVIQIDFSRFLHPEDLSLLVGAPPGYVGYSDSLPLHKLEQTPWCVLLFENVDAAHPYIREFVSQALNDGRMLDGRGKPIYLADTIVLMTSELSIQEQRNFGFLPDDQGVSPDELNSAIREAVGEQILAQVDMVFFGNRGQGGISREWLESYLLADVTRRYRGQNIELIWDEGLIVWLMEQLGKGFSRSDWESWVDRTLTGVLIPHLPIPGEPVKSLRVMIEKDELKVVPEQKGI